jgi:hypothetical protein
MSGLVSIVRQLLDAGLLDELHLLVQPIAVREGMRYSTRANPPCRCGWSPPRPSPPVFCTSSIPRLNRLPSARTRRPSAPDPAAFSELLRLSALVGECLGVSARSLADGGSWANVADVAGVTRQAAWSRWRSETL